MTNVRRDDLARIVERFIANARTELEYRWNEWPLDPSRLHVHEVIGALLARQVSLAVNIASAPSIWNSHAAPVLLRSMADVIISIGWILELPDERSERFVLYGLGQLKLENEHRKAVLDPNNPDPREQRIIEANDLWISQQRDSSLIEVNLGAWSETNTRKMADEAGLLEFYNFVYQTFSAATHSAWHHVGKFNVRYCLSPLHRHHRVPDDLDIPNDSWFFYLAGKYLARAFDLFDTKTGITPPSVSAFDSLLNDLESFAEANRQGVRSSTTQKENDEDNPTDLTSRAR